MSTTGIEISKQDWDLFREKLPGWQERYLERLLKGYVEYLESNEEASTKFWGLEKMIKRDKNTPGVQLRLNKTDIDAELARMILEGFISEDDLDGFSDELIQRVKQLAAGFKDAYSGE